MTGLSELVCASSREPAMINRAAVAIAKPSRIFYGSDGQEISPDLITTYNSFKHDVINFDVSKVISTNMQPSNDSSAVFAQIFDRSASYVVSRPEFRNTSLGRTTTQVEHAMKQEVVVNTDPSGVQHKVNFNIQALQTCAQLQYSGVMKAAVKYTISNSTLGLEVAEKVFSNKDLVLSQSYGSQRVSEVSLRWSF